MIYFYWGNKILSFLRFMTLYSACKYNNNVTLILKKDETISGEWTEKQDFNIYNNIDYTGWIKYLYLINENLKIEYLEDDYSEIAKLKASEIHTSDLLAWYILANKGGTVSDMDILYFKPVPKIEHDICLISFDQYPLPGYIPVSFMQGRPNKFFKDIYEKALENYNPAIYECCGNISIGCSFEDIPKEFKKKRLLSKLVMPFAEDYEWYKYRRMMFKETHPLPDECIGIHWYAGRNQDYNNLITHLTIDKYPCTITDLIKRVYESFNN